MAGIATIHPAKSIGKNAKVFLDLMKTEQDGSKSKAKPSGPPLLRSARAWKAAPAAKAVKGKK